MRTGSVLHNVALIILNYNSPAMTIRAVKGLLAYRTEMQLIVVDNCSKDDSRERFTAEFENEKNVHLVFNDTNYGYAHGNNVGIAYAKAMKTVDVVGIMNPDVVVATATLEVLVAKLTADDNIGLITAETYYNGVYNVPNDCAWQIPTIAQLLCMFTCIGFVCNRTMKLLGKHYNAQNHYPPQHYEENDVAYVDVVQGCFFMGKLSTLEAIGCLDEHTFLYYEENILASKIKRVGKRNAVLTGYYIEHNHQEKDKRLIKRANKIFDMTCMHESRDYYIANYADFNIMTKLVLRGVLKIDFYLRRLGVQLVFRD